MKKTHLHFSDREIIYNISYSNIIRIEARRSSCIVFLEEGESKLVSKSMKKLMEEADEEQFIKTHRSHIINMEKVEDFNIKLNKVVMKNGDLIPVSDNEKPDFLKKYNQQ